MATNDISIFEYVAFNINKTHTRNSFELAMCIYGVIAKPEKVHGKKIKLKNSFFCQSI